MPPEDSEGASELLETSSLAKVLRRALGWGEIKAMHSKVHSIVLSVSSWPDSKESYCWKLRNHFFSKKEIHSVFLN